MHLSFRDWTDLGDIPDHRLQAPQHLDCMSYIPEIDDAQRNRLNRRSNGHASPQTILAFIFSLP